MPSAREMPLVPGLPLLGSALDLLNDPGRALVDAYRTYGPAFRIRVLGTEVVVLAGAQALPSLRESAATRLLPDVDLARFSPGTAIVLRARQPRRFISSRAAVSP